MRRALLAILPLCAATGCNELVERLQEQINDQAMSAAQGTLADEEKLSNKLSVYAECTNMSRQRVFTVWEAVARDVNPDGTPKNENGRVTTLELDDVFVNPCVKAVDEGGKLEPSLPELEKAQSEYTTSLREFATANNELHKYFEEENYKDDEWAKSKELVPKMIAAFERWQAANKGLDQVLDAKEDEANNQMLAFIEQESGKNLEYHSRSYLLKAKGFLRCLDQQKPAAEACEEPFTALEAGNTEFRTYFDANKAEGDKIILFSSFESSVEDFFTESKKVMRELRESKADPEKIEKVIDEYNELIDNSNRLQFPAA